MRLDIKARLERALSGIGCYLRPIEVHLFPPHQSCLLALLHNLLKEAAKDIDPVALTDAGQAGMIGKRLTQIVPHKPAHAQSICCMPHQLALGAYPFKKHDQLQFEEDDRINGGAASACIGLVHELPDKREIQLPFKIAIEMVLRDQLF